MSVGNFGMLKNLDQVKRLADLLMTSGKTVSFDLETGYSGPEEMDKGALNVYLPNQFIAGFSITNDPQWARYVPLMHDFGDNLDPTEVWPIMKPVLEELPVLAHNVVFEGRNLHALDWKGHGPRIHLDPTKFHDSMLQSYVLSESPQHGLKFLSGYHYDHDQAEIETLFDKKLTAKQLKSLRFNVLELTESVVNYACDDVVWALRLDQDFRERCLKERGFIYKMELQIADILIDMADTGVSVDWDGISVGNSQFARFYQLMENRTRELFEEASGRDLTDLNFRSAPQMRKLLYGDLGLTTTRMTKGENPLPSTSEVALEGLRKQHPAVEQLLKYRQTKKMGEWFDAWSKLRVCNDEKIHPGFNQTRVQSGRFASDSPNVQNITKKWWFSMIPRDLATFPETKDGNKAYEEHVKDVGTNGVDYWTGNARDYLIASPGYTLLSFDYQAAEMRVLAGLSQEPALLKAFAEGADVHKTAAALAFKVPIEEVTPDQRQKAKAQPLTAKVLTPTGWRLMGDLQVGDSVIGADGHSTKIRGIYPSGKRPIYRVTTTNGSTESTGDHYWTVRHYSHEHPWKTVTLNELMKRPLLTRDGGGQPKWELPARSSVHFDPQPELPMNPYVLGLLLGDGTFRHEWAPSFSSADPELLVAVRDYHESLGGVVQEKRRGDEQFWTQYLTCSPYESGPRNVMRNPLRLKIRELGLDMKKADSKFIPSQYLTASAEDRLALLQGLMDTDGSVLKSGGLFHNTSEQLADGVVELVLSLGGSATKRLRREAAPDSMGKFASKLRAWDVYLRLPHDVPFRLPRKADKVLPVQKWPPPKIVSVELVGEKECQCISVEAENGLYVTDDYLTTHNTVQFGLVYGQGAQGLAEGLGIPKDEAQGIMDKYFSAFSKVDEWFTKVKSEGFERGYVESFMGRKSTIWELESSNRAVRSKSERMFVNIPVQGGAADYCKVAMIRSKTALEKAGWWNDEVRLLMNQHDSLVYEVRDDLDMQEVIDLLTPAVSFPVKGFPTMEVDWECGHRWGSVRQFGEEEGAPTPVVESTVPEQVSEVSKVYVVFSGSPDKDTVQEIGKVLRHHEGDIPVFFSISGQSLPLPMTIALDETLHADVTVASNGTACIETEQPTTEEVPA